MIVLREAIMIAQRPKSQLLCISLLLLFAFLVGCESSVAPSAGRTNTRTPILEGSPPAVRTTIAQVPPSSPKGTVAATRLRPTPTFVLPTSLPSPTLTIQQERAVVVAMLEDNGDCELPCWWGITPTVTTWQAVRDLLASYGKQTSSFQYADGTTAHSTRDFEVQGVGHYDYRIGFIFLEQGGIVEAIQVSSEVFRGAVAEYFAQDWHRYSLDQMLTRYGEPSQVFLQLFPSFEPDSANYTVVVLYDQLGIAVRYWGLAAVVGDKVQVCPVLEQVNMITLWLQTPQNTTPLMQRVITSDESSYFQSLEKTTGLTMQAFYDTFRDGDSGACLEGQPTLP